MNKYIKKPIIYALSSSIHKIKSEILRHEIISFDLFDTLITRYVPVSTDLIEVMSYEAALIAKCSAQEFINTRLYAERIAVAKAYPIDASIYDIYNCYPNLSETQKKKLVKIEINCELEYTVPRDEVVDLFDYAISNGKKVVIITDTPLEKTIIEKILNRCGIKGYSNLYVSVECNANKYKGELFKIVLQNEKVVPEKILHIGDALRSDYLNAKKYRIHSCLINLFKNNNCIVHNNNKEYYKKKCGYRILRKIIELKEPIKYNDYEKIGYEILGPLLVSFCHWLKKNNKKIKMFIFLAREGIIIRDAFKKIYPRDNCEILRVSRRLVTGCSLYDIENIDELFNALKSFSLFGLTLNELTDLGYIELDDSLSFSTKYKISQDADLVSGDVDGSIKNAFDKEILPIIKSYSREQKKMLEDYLVDKLKGENDLSLVDVGWRGTMQDKLMSSFFFDKNIIVKGFYYGVNIDNRIASNSKLNKSGALFETNGETPEELSSISLTGQIFELLFMDLKKGTALRFERNNGEICVVTDASEYNGETAKALCEIQKAAFQFIDHYCMLGKKINEIEFECRDAFEQYNNLCLNPSNKTIHLFKNFYTKDVTLVPLVAQHNIIYWGVHPIRFYKTLKLNHCRSWFIKSVFKIPFPYYYVMRKIENFLVKR